MSVAADLVIGRCMYFFFFGSPFSLFLFNILFAR